MDTLIGTIIGLVILNLGWSVAQAARLGHLEGKIDALLKNNGIDPKKLHRNKK